MPTDTLVATARDWVPLLRRARAAGFDHIVYGFGERIEHVWRTPEWQISVEFDDEDGEATAELTLVQRRNPPARRWDRQRTSAWVDTTDQATALLEAFGVLPAEGARA